MKFSIKDFFSKCDQIRRKLRIWSHLLKKCLMENFIFCAVVLTMYIFLNLYSFYILHGCSVSRNNPYINFGAILCFTLNLSLMNCESILFLAIHQKSKLDLHVVRVKSLSCNLLIRLFKDRLWNIQTREQYWNWDEKIVTAFLLLTWVHLKRHIYQYED